MSKHSCTDPFGDPDNPPVIYRCEDGHEWVVQPDGGVSPSWGYGGTSVKYDQPATSCPEPAVPDGYSHGYTCPTCGRHNYAGGCTGPNDENWYASKCEPPVPGCCKPGTLVARWGKQPLPREKGKQQKYLGNWLPVDREPEPGEQLVLS